MIKNCKLLISLFLIVFILSGCGNTESSDKTQIVLSDGEITVDGAAISTNETENVYVGADIIYYEEGQDETYGEGTSEDVHSKEEADKHTVITITKPGTYEVSGRLSYGQIVIDLGKDAEDNEKAVVNLILNHVEMNCEVAPAILIQNVYECSSGKKKDATPNVNLENAGFHLMLAKDSENKISGSYVAKIYKDGTTKKKYKFDGAIHSEASFTIDAEENGKLNVEAKNEGIVSTLHMTVNSGEITIHSGNDAMNTNDNDVSVLTINGGTLLCNAGFGKEGDGMDSNGYIVINGGTIYSYSNPKTDDKGLDADAGIFINGGKVLATGNDYDVVSEDSKQKFVVFQLQEKVKSGQQASIIDKNNKSVIDFETINDFKVLIYSQPDLDSDNCQLTVQGE